MSGTAWSTRHSTPFFHCSYKTALSRYAFPLSRSSSYSLYCASFTLRKDIFSTANTYVTLSTDLPNPAPQPLTYPCCTRLNTFLTSFYPLRGSLTSSADISPEQPYHFLYSAICYAFHLSTKKLPSPSSRICSSGTVRASMHIALPHPKIYVCSFCSSPNALSSQSIWAPCAAAAGINVVKDGGEAAAKNVSLKEAESPVVPRRFPTEDVVARFRAAARLHSTVELLRLMKQTDVHSLLGFQLVACMHAAASRCSSSISSKGQQQGQQETGSVSACPAVRAHSFWARCAGRLLKGDMIRRIRLPILVNITTAFSKGGIFLFQELPLSRRDRSPEDSTDLLLHSASECYRGHLAGNLIAPVCHPHSHDFSNETDAAERPAAFPLKPLWQHSQKQQRLLEKLGKLPLRNCQWHQKRSEQQQEDKLWQREQQPSSLQGDVSGTSCKQLSGSWNSANASLVWVIHRVYFRIADRLLDELQDVSRNRNSCTDSYSSNCIESGSPSRIVSSQSDGLNCRQQCKTMKNSRFELCCERAELWRSVLVVARAFALLQRKTITELQDRLQQQQQLLTASQRQRQLKVTNADHLKVPQEDRQDELNALPHIKTNNAPFLPRSSESVTKNSLGTCVFQRHMIDIEACSIQRQMNETRQRLQQSFFFFRLFFGRLAEELLLFLQTEHCCLPSTEDYGRIRSAMVSKAESSVTYKKQSETNHLLSYEKGLQQPQRADTVESLSQLSFRHKELPHKLLVALRERLQPAELADALQTLNLALRWTDTASLLLCRMSDGAATSAAATVERSQSRSGSSSERFSTVHLDLRKKKELINASDAAVFCSLGGTTKGEVSTSAGRTISPATHGGAKRMFTFAGTAVATEIHDFTESFFIPLGCLPSLPSATHQQQQQQKKQPRPEQWDLQQSPVDRHTNNLSAAEVEQRNDHPSIYQQKDIAASLVIHQKRCHSREFGQGTLQQQSFHAAAYELAPRSEKAIADHDKEISRQKKPLSLLQQQVISIPATMPGAHESCQQREFAEVAQSNIITETSNNVSNQSTERSSRGRMLDTPSSVAGERHAGCRRNSCFHQRHVPSTEPDKTTAPETVHSALLAGNTRAFDCACEGPADEARAPAPETTATTLQHSASHVNYLRGCSRAAKEAEETQDSLVATRFPNAESLGWRSALDSIGGKTELTTAPSGHKEFFVKKSTSTPEDRITRVSVLAVQVGCLLGWEAAVALYESFAFLHALIALVASALVPAVTQLSHANALTLYVSLCRTQFDLQVAQTALRRFFSLRTHKTFFSSQSSSDGASVLPPRLSHATCAAPYYSRAASYPCVNSTSTCFPFPNGSSYSFPFPIGSLLSSLLASGRIQATAQGNDGQRASSGRSVGLAVAAAGAAAAVDPSLPASVSIQAVPCSANDAAVLSLADAASASVRLVTPHTYATADVSTSQGVGTGFFLENTSYTNGHANTVSNSLPVTAAPTSTGNISRAMAEEQAASPPTALFEKNAFRRSVPFVGKDNCSLGQAAVIIDEAVSVSLTNNCNAAGISGSNTDCLHSTGSLLLSGGAMQHILLQRLLSQPSGFLREVPVNDIPSFMLSLTKHLGAREGQMIVSTPSERCCSNEREYNVILGTLRSGRRRLPYAKCSSSSSTQVPWNKQFSYKSSGKRHNRPEATNILARASGSPLNDDSSSTNCYAAAFGSPQTVQRNADDAVQRIVKKDRAIAPSAPETFILPRVTPLSLRASAANLLPALARRLAYEGVASASAAAAVKVPSNTRGSGSNQRFWTSRGLSCSAVADALTALADALCEERTAVLALTRHTLRQLVGALLDRQQQQHHRQLLKYGKQQVIQTREVRGGEHQLEKTQHRGEHGMLESVNITAVKQRMKTYLSSPEYPESQQSSSSMLSQLRQHDCRCAAAPASSSSSRSNYSVRDGHKERADSWSSNSTRIDLYETEESSSTADEEANVRGVLNKKQLSFFCRVINSILKLGHFEKYIFSTDFYQQVSQQRRKSLEVIFAEENLPEAFTLRELSLFEWLLRSNLSEITPLQVHYLTTSLLCSPAFCVSWFTTSWHLDESFAYARSRNRRETSTNNNSGSSSRCSGMGWGGSLKETKATLPLAVVFLIEGLQVESEVWGDSSFAELSLRQLQTGLLAAAVGVTGAVMPKKNGSTEPFTHRNENICETNTSPDALEDSRLSSNTSVCSRYTDNKFYSTRHRDFETRTFSPASSDGSKLSAPQRPRINCTDCQTTAANKQLQVISALHLLSLEALKAGRRVLQRVTQAQRQHNISIISYMQEDVLRTVHSILKLLPDKKKNIFSGINSAYHIMALEAVIGPYSVDIILTITS